MIIKYKFVLKNCLLQVPHAALDMEYKSLIDCLHTAIMAGSNDVTVHGFEME